MYWCLQCVDIWLIKGGGVRTNYFDQYVSSTVLSKTLQQALHNKAALTCLDAYLE